MLRVGLISDTHGLLRPRSEAFLQGSDYIVARGRHHCDPAILEGLRQSLPVTAVRVQQRQGLMGAQLRAECLRWARLSSTLSTSSLDSTLSRAPPGCVLSRVWAFTQALGRRARRRSVCEPGRFGAASFTFAPSLPENSSSTGAWCLGARSELVGRMQPDPHRWQRNDHPSRSALVSGGRRCLSRRVCRSVSPCARAALRSGGHVRGGDAHFAAVFGVAALAPGAALFFQAYRVSDGSRRISDL